MIINSEVIKSRNNEFVRWAATLQEKKGRYEAECFIAEGIKLSLEALEAGLPISHIIINDAKQDSIFEKIKPFLSDERHNAVKIIFVSDEAFAKISTEKAPQGVITVIKYLDFFREMNIIYKEEIFESADERAILLCSVRDPSNLGSVIRSSVAFGTEHVFLTEDCADLYSPKTVRSAMGSLFRVKTTRVRDTSGFIDALKASGRRVLAAELTEGARSLSDIALSPTDVVVIGNEGHGIPREVSCECSGSVYIPISKRTESLNASVAAAIFMWEQSKG